MKNEYGFFFWKQYLSSLSDKFLQQYNSNFLLLIFLPGDQILDINGIEVGGRSVSEISEIIKGSPELVVCTVKPSSDYRYCDTHTTEHTEYAEIDLDSLKTKDEEDSGVLSNNSSFDNQAESEDKKTSANSQFKRHSLPTVLPDSQSTKERNKEQSVNYLELNFPGNERPRGRSELSRSPRLPPRANREQGTPGAYIELEFNSKENKNQGLEACREGTGTKPGDGKSNSLPRR